MTVTYFPVGELRANCVLLCDGNGHAAVVDPGGDAPRILEKVRSMGATVDVILLTHAHFDHMLGVRELQAETGAPLFIHEADAPALSDASLNLMSMVCTPYALSADRLLKDGDAVSVGTDTWTVLHTPGHTRGSACYYGDGVLVSGDTLFAGSMGRTDLPGGSTEQMVQSLRRLSTLPEDVRVIPGHGEETTIGFERRYNPFLMGN